MEVVVVVVVGFWPCLSFLWPSVAVVRRGRWPPKGAFDHAADDDDGAEEDEEEVVVEGLEMENYLMWPGEQANRSSFLIQ